jgi:hypothetical protein
MFDSIIEFEEHVLELKPEQEIVRIGFKPTHGGPKNIYI